MIKNRFSRLIRFTEIKLRGLKNLSRFYVNWPEILAYRLGMKSTECLTYKLKNGLRIITRTNDVDAQILTSILLGEYSFGGFAVKPNDTVIDIGANIGTFSLLAASKAKRGQIYSFEPLTDNFNLFRKNLKLNKLTNVKVFNKAVFNKAARKRLYIYKESKGMSNFFDKKEHYETVEAITLGEVFKENKINRCQLLKLDCEGSEFEILTGTSGSIYKKIDKIILEYHPRLSQTHKLQQLIGLLQKNNMRIVSTKKSGANGILFLKNNFRS